MTEGLVGTAINSGLPAHTLGAGVGTSTPPPPPATVAAGSSAPVWQPWVETHAKAQSILKTQINQALIVFNREMADAQRMIDAAQAIAAEQTRQLEAAAWSAWKKYMDEAVRVNNAVMVPALATYEKAIDAAHDKASAQINRAHHTYDQAKDLTSFSSNLAVGSDTM